MNVLTLPLTPPLYGAIYSSVMRLKLFFSFKNSLYSYSSLFSPTVYDIIGPILSQSPPDSLYAEPVYIEKNLYGSSEL